MIPSIYVNGVPVFSPGERARFVVAEDIQVTILSTTVRSAADVLHLVTWIDSGNRKEEVVRSFELEPVR